MLLTQPQATELAIRYRFARSPVLIRWGDGDRRAYRGLVRLGLVDGGELTQRGKAEGVKRWGDVTYLDPVPSWGLSLPFPYWRSLDS